MITKNSDEKSLQEVFGAEDEEQKHLNQEKMIFFSKDQQNR